MPDESDKNAAVTKDDSFQILQKVEDMMVYAYPIVGRWSVADKYVIGNDLMDCMKTMMRLAVDISEKHYKKTTLGEFDRENKVLQKYIKVAYRLKIMKGLSNYKEWTRRSEEIGKMLGGYIKAVEDKEKADGNTANQKPKTSGNRGGQYNRKW